MIGQKFGRLTVQGEAPRKHGRLAVACLCDCGQPFNALAKDLKSGNTKSCGCLRRELSAKRTTERKTHGHCSGDVESPTYRSWHSMLNRCRNPADAAYERYGARGISVCDRWMTFANFLADMGERPAGTSIDRFPNNIGNYEPGNCRWATRKQQTANRAVSIFLEAEGKRQTIGEWADEKGLPYIQLHRRLSKGWPIDRALNKPLEARKPRAT